MFEDTGSFRCCRRLPITVAAPRRDWEGLERKLARGMPLERAAEAMGIPMEEAQRWAQQAADAREPVRGAVGHEALLDAVAELRETLKAEDPPEEVDEDGFPRRRRGRPAGELRIMAAIALGRMGLQLAKLERAAVAAKTKSDTSAAQSQRDLFDLAPPDPWAD